MDKIEKAIMECYRRMYAISEPSADFDQLIRDAKINEFGQKEIPFNEHQILEQDYTRIVDEVIKQFRIAKYMRQRFKGTIALGCSPKFMQPKPTVVLKVPVDVELSKSLQHLFKYI